MPPRKKKNGAKGPKGPPPKTENGKEYCKATASSTGKRCKQYALAGGYCRRHRSRGAIGNTVTGRFARAPQHFREALATAKEQGDLWDSEVSLALMDVRAGELVSRLECEEGPDDAGFRTEATRLHNSLELEARRGRPAQLVQAIQKLGAHLSAGGDRDRIWHDLVRLTIQRERRADDCKAMELRSEVAMNVRHVEAIVQLIFTILGQELDHEDALRCINRITSEVLDPSAGALPAEVRAR